MAISRTQIWAFCMTLVAAIAFTSAIPTSPLGISLVGTASFAAGAAPSVAVPDVGGYFFVYNGRDLLRYDSATVNLLGTQPLPSNLAFTFVGGRIQYQKSTDVIFICSGSGVGLTAASGLEPITIIWNAPSSSEVVGCSAEVPDVLWIAVRRQVPADSSQLYAIRPADLTLKEPWLQQSGNYFFPNTDAESINIMPSGEAYFTGTSTLHTFNAVPEPTAIPQTASQAMPSAWKRIYTVNETNSILLVTPPRAFLRDTTTVAWNVVFGVDVSSSAALDAVNKVYWKSYCDISFGNPTSDSVVIERFTMDPDVVLKPTHKTGGLYGCSFMDFAEIQVAGYGGIDRIANRVITIPLGNLVLVTKLYDCSLATTCDECSLESMYCSWCVGPTGTSCIPKATCAAPNASLSSCPDISSSAPTTISAEGTNDILLTGSNFASAERQLAALGGLHCKVGSSLSKASVFSEALLRCNINPITQIGDTPIYFALNNSQSIDTISSKSIRTYSCNNVDSCTACSDASHRDCQWCTIDSVCKSRLAPDASCPTLGSSIVSFGNSASTCTLLTQISPQSIPIHFSGVPGIPQSVNLQASFPNVANGWTCDFGSTSVAGTLNYDTQTLTCAIPVITLPPQTSELDIPVRVKLNGNYFAANFLTLTYYDCAIPTTCGSCATPSRPFCNWCLSTVACMANTSSCTNFLPFSSSCPTASMTPLSTLGTAPTPLTITGGPFLVGSPYQCNFTGQFSSFVAASTVTSTTITCSAPSASVTNFFNVQVSIVLANRIYVSVGELRYYTCSASVASCGACADPLHTACAWCVETSACDTDAGMGTSCSSKVGPGFCPAVTAVSPAAGSYTGGQLVTLTGAGFNYLGTYECHFSGPTNATANDIYVPATVQSATTATCTSPARPTTKKGPYAITIRYNDTTAHSNSLLSSQVFSMIDCFAIDLCTNCAAIPQCQWCAAEGLCKLTGGSCTFNRIVTSPPMCPIVTNVAPLAAEKGHITTIAVTGTNLHDSAILPYLRCQLDGAVQLMAFNTSNGVGAQDTFQCTTNPLVSAAQKPFAFNVEVIKRAEYAPYRDISGAPIIFDVYDCASLLTCDECANATSNVCGWCSADAKCSPQSSCSQSSSWDRRRCPRVTRLPRTSVDENAIGKPFELFASHLDQLGTTRLVCSFATPVLNVTTPVSSTSLIDGKVICPLGNSPTGSTSSFAAKAVVSLLHADNLAKWTSNAADAFFDPNANLEFIKCQRDVIPITSCSSCMLAKGSEVDSRCGWCVYDGYCGISSSCSVGFPLPQYQNSSSLCASVIDVQPREGPSTGSTQLTITGVGLIQSDRLKCKFGDLFSNTVFQSDTSVTCVTPARDDLSSGSASSDFALVLFKVPANRRADEFVIFATTSQPISFTYNYVAPDKKSNLGWIAAPIIAAVIIIIVAIVVLIILRKRYRQKKLTPPDYPKYAFSANAKLIREVPEGKKSALDDIAHLLSEDSYSFGLALAEVSSGTDDDLLSRSLIYAAYPNTFALDMLVKFIENEVQRSGREGELFRASSLACKMYTIYSKIVGIQYLWKTLARSIHTLDDAGQAEDRRQNSGSSTTTPPSTGHVSMIDLGTLEVDPERLADKLEKEVDSAVLTDVSIYQYELLLKTGRIFKKVMDSVNTVPRELRIAAKRVKAAVSQKYTEREMDYKGVCAFFFLRFICPAVMTPQIYGVLEHPPGETSQRYFVLIAKTIQNLANGTLPSHKEAYMAKMDEFVIDNKDTLHRFIDNLCTVQDVGSENDVINDESAHNAKDMRLDVSDELYYSSLLFIHTHYMAHHSQIQDGFKARHEDELGQRVHETMLAACDNEEPGPKKNGKKPKKHLKASSSK